METREAIKHLADARQKTWHEMKELNDATFAGDGSARSFSAEEQAAWDRMNADLAAKDARIKELSELADREDTFAEQRERFSRTLKDTSPQVDATEAEILKVLRGESRGVDIHLGGMQRRVDPKTGAWEVRDLTVVTAAAGGTTVPFGFVHQLYEHMVQMTAIRQTNVRVLTTDSGESMTFPKTASFGTAAIVGEGSALAEADPSFGSVTLLAWKYGQLLQVSTELTQDTGVDLLGFVAKDMARALAQATGTKYINGTGTNEPTGIIASFGTGVTGGTGVAGVPTSDNIIDLYYSVIPPYRANAFWVMADATIAAIRKLKTTTNEYLWAPGSQPNVGSNLQGAAPDLLLGKPVVDDPFMPALGTGLKSIAFGDFDAFVIRDVGAVRFERSDEFAFGNDLISYRAIMRTDSKAIDLTGAVKLFRGGTA